MSEQRLPRHGRNHGPTGSDPLPNFGILFDYDNEGGYLYVQTNDCFDLDLLPDPLAVGGMWGKVLEDDSGCGTLIGSTNRVHFKTPAEQHSISTDGGTFVIKDHLGVALITYTG